MNINSYSLNFFSPQGEKLYVFSAILELEFGRKKNDIGAASILIPNLGIYDINKFERNCMLEIYRNGKIIPVLWFLKKARITDSEIELVFFDHITLLTQRYVTWYEVDGYQYPSHLRMEADILITEVVRTNFGVGVADDLGYTPISVPDLITDMGPNNRKMPFTVINATGEASIIEDSFAFKKVLDVLQSATKTAENNGENIWFDFTYTPNIDGYNIGELIFQTWVGLRNNDRRIGHTNSPIVFSPDIGNLVDYEIEIDFENFHNQVYVTAKELPEVDDGISLVRMVAYPQEYASTGFDLVEIVEASKDDETNTAIMLDNAKAIFQDGRAVKRLTGDIVQTANNKFFINYDFGDKISAYWGTLFFETEIDTYNVNVGVNEEIRIPFDAKSS